MPFFPSLKPDASVSDVYRAWRPVYTHWMRMGHEVMSAAGPLSKGERELIATYVSSLNDCAYCRTAHLAAMALHGIGKEVVDALVADIASAPVEERFKPLFRFVRKLTLEPATVEQADADAVYHAGWGEDALRSAIAVACHFNFMNRLVMGYGLAPLNAESAKAGAALRNEHGYAHLAPQVTGARSEDAAE